MTICDNFTNVAKCEKKLGKTTILPRVTEAQKRVFHVHLLELIFCDHFRKKVCLMTICWHFIENATVSSVKIARICVQIFIAFSICNKFNLPDVAIWNKMVDVIDGMSYYQPFFTYKEQQWWVRIDDMCISHNVFCQYHEDNNLPDHTHIQKNCFHLHRSYFQLLKHCKL